MGKYKRMVSIGAHPLDAELQGGPLMIKYAKEGAVCTFVHVVKGRLTEPGATEEEKRDYEETLKKEIMDAAQAMGCNALCLDYTSAELPAVEEFAEKIADYLRKEGADCVITHGRGTLHPRHYYTYEAVTSAVRKLRREGGNIQLYYGENCEDLAGFTPTLYVSMSQEDEETWFAGLRKYTIFGGAVNDVPYYDYYHTMGKVRAMEAGTDGKVKAYMHAPLIDNE